MTDSIVAGLEDLAPAIIGRKIVSASEGVITLDDGTTATLTGYGDCCARAGVEALLLHPDSVDHAITNVTAEEGEDGTEVWHFLADMSNVLDITVGYSEGTGYYSYGIDVSVKR